MLLYSVFFVFSDRISRSNKLLLTTEESFGFQHCQMSESEDDVNLFLADVLLDEFKVRFSLY